MLTSFLRRYRDAYTLLVRKHTGNSSALVCELNSRFAVMKTLEQCMTQEPNTLVSIAGMTDSDVKDPTRMFFRYAKEAFKDGIGSLQKFVSAEREKIASVTPYDVVTKNVVAEDLMRWGSTLCYSRKIQHNRSSSLDNLRRICSTDSAGFLVLDGLHVICHYAGAEYYVYESGALLCKRGGKFTPMYHKGLEDSEVATYNRILESRWSNNGNTDT